jgi:hypothetical protein
VVVNYSMENPDINNLKIKVIIGSTRQNRFSEKPAHWIYEEVKKKKEVDAELLDLRDYQMPFFDDAVSPAMAEGKEQVPVNPELFNPLRKSLTGDRVENFLNELIWTTRALKTARQPNN